MPDFRISQHGMDVVFKLEAEAQRKPGWTGALYTTG
jgi:hypothetical protein